MAIPFPVTDSRTNERMWLRKTNCKHCNGTLEIVELDADGNYTHPDGTLGNVQGDDLEDQRNEKRKRFGLTYWGMEDECTREEIAERVKATQALPDDYAFGK
jgi:hypothetical protein